MNCPISTTLTFPVFVYGHNNTDGGRAVTGGFVYRGTDYPVFNGYYFFADDISRRFWALNTANNQVTALGQMLAPGANPSTFGQSPDGEIYVADLDGGGIYKLTGPTPRAYLPLIGVGGN